MPVQEKPFLVILGVGAVSLFVWNIGYVFVVLRGIGARGFFDQGFITRNLKRYRQRYAKHQGRMLAYKIIVLAAWVAALCVLLGILGMAVPVLSE